MVIQKYGEECFKIEQIDSASTMEELNLKEQQHILEYNSIAPNGYNLTSGGCNYADSIETREKKRIASSNRVVTEEARLKISKAKLGVKISDIAKYKQKLGKHLKSLYGISGKGVRYCNRDNSYQAFIYIDGKITTKTFTVSVYGDNSLDMAIHQRRLFEDEATEYYKSKIKEPLNG
jgi:hypothetical protein